MMAVRAHPDDECFTVGGCFAHYGDLGYRTVLVTCTGGENGEIVDPELDTDEVRAHLGEVRKAELETSCRILGITDLEMLGYRDSGMADTPENEDPRSFNKADLDEATGRLVLVIRKYKPQVLITDNEEGSYGHPDHIMANRITVEAYGKAADQNYRPDLGPPFQAQKLYYTAWSLGQVRELWRRMRELGIELPWRRDGEDADTEPTWGLPDEDVGAIVDVRRELARKFDSLRAHRTQIKPDLWMLTLPEQLQRDFQGYETFQRVRSELPIEGREDDLFNGVVEGDIESVA
jgi:N-acetyl-1-D-myo-inositol-2-amino-2-deoxy-alpha-D-glucopyranoside deacetylase